MKKRKIVAMTLAALAAGAANAQSSVTIFGIADVGVTIGRGSTANVTQLSQGNLTASRIGFRGVEDLGGGVSARFQLESGINIDDGRGQATNTSNQASGGAIAGIGGSQGLTFNRQSWVGLAGPGGQVRLGRDWTPTFWSYLKYDIANGGGTATSQAALGSIGAYGSPVGLRASNAIEYLSPELSGVQAHLMYALGENPSNAGRTRDDGRYVGGRLSYVGGPIDMSVAYAKYSVASVGDIHETILGGTYKFNVLKLHAMYTRNTTGSASNMRGALLGASYQFGATEVRASVSTSTTKNLAGATTGDVQKLALMALYSFSKRTTLYAIYAHDRNRSGATAVPLPGYAITAANQPASALSLGVWHSF